MLRRGGLALCAVLATSGALAGCRTTESTRPAAPDPPIVYRAQATRAWDVLSAQGAVTGSVVHFASEAAPEQSVWVVRNPHGQDLGWVDSLGRAYRLLPHHREPAWVGTGTVGQGVERILRSEGPCTLRERALEEGPPPPEAAGSDS